MPSFFLPIAYENLIMTAQCMHWAWRCCIACMALTCIVCRASCAPAAGCTECLGVRYRQQQGSASGPCGQVPCMRHGMCGSHWKLLQARCGAVWHIGARQGLGVVMPACCRLFGNSEYCNCCKVHVSKQVGCVALSKACVSRYG